MFSTVTNLPSARIGFFCGFLLILTGCNAGGCNGGGEDPSNGNTSRLGKFSHDDDVVMKMALFDFRAPVDGVGNDVAISKVGGEVTFTSPDGTSWVAPVDTHTDWASVPVALHVLTCPQMLYQGL